MEYVLFGFIYLMGAFVVGIGCKAFAGMSWGASRDAYFYEWFFPALFWPLFVFWLLVANFIRWGRRIRGEKR